MPRAHVTLRNPACQSTARSNIPSTRMISGQVRTFSEAYNPPLLPGRNRWAVAAPVLRPYRLPSKGNTSRWLKVSWPSTFTRPAC